MRRLREIRRELEELSLQRTLLWEQLGSTRDRSTAIEVARLGARIEALWSEARRLKAEIRSGPRETILARARAHELLDRELAKRLRRTLEAEARAREPV
jgi:hypothetical protein